MNTRELNCSVMENSPANQLPEVDSLPDGFVERSEQEKNDADYKDTLSELDLSNESRHELASASPDSSAVNDIRLAESKAETTEKTRTFPVPLSEKDSLDACGDSLDAAGKVCVGDSEVGSNMHEMANSAAESSEMVSSYNELTTDPSHIEGACQISDRLTEGCSELQATNLKERSAPENTESQRNRKLTQETAEGKRKSGKRSLKSEKEFLEFTLKYQQVIAERDAAIAVRDKLESLCRELQRQNKMLMDECKRVSTEGQSIRQDLSTKFHDAIKDVSNKLEEQKDECLSQLKENEMLRNKLKLLADQYAITEQQFTHKLKQKTLELQIADLKIHQHEEKLTQEQSQMKLYAEQVSQLLATEKNLRLQLAADGEKFQQFQDALSKSNEVFETFKQEIEKMAKSIKELKKENVFLKSKCEKSDFTLIELVEEREHQKKQLEKMKNQKEKLESLCRSLQAERKQVSLGSNNTNDVPVEVKMVSPTAES
ncbi:alpha-taxilin isoform X3 [Telopea speciosissima]|uniref:alpha-taxilin isoform X3 n=1 Tax=Telopea speciosissima TaxID=54955 RepID=UPI001CC6D5DF|nr:alpha-taxilin isoform X3 [Telopea speciosissima]